MPRRNYPPRSRKQRKAFNRAFQQAAQEQLHYLKGRQTGGWSNEDHMGVHIPRRIMESRFAAERDQETMEPS